MFPYVAGPRSWKPPASRCSPITRAHIKWMHTAARYHQTRQGRERERVMHSGRRTECVRKNKSIGIEREKKKRKGSARVRLCTETAACNVTSNLPLQRCETNRRCSSCVTDGFGKGTQDLFNALMTIQTTSSPPIAACLSGSSTVSALFLQFGGEEKPHFISRSSDLRAPLSHVRSEHQGCCWCQPSQLSIALVTVDLTAGAVPC